MTQKKKTADDLISMLREVIEKQADVRRLMDEAHSLANDLDGDKYTLGRVRELCSKTSSRADDASDFATSALELLCWAKRVLRATERRSWSPSTAS